MHSNACRSGGGISRALLAAYACSQRVAILGAAWLAITVGVSPVARGAMAPSIQITGQVGYELAGVASPGPPVIGNISLSNIPGGALINFVYLYTNDFVGVSSGGGQIDASITPPVGPAIPVASNAYPTSSDPVPIAGTFGYELNILPTAVTGNGSYGVSISPSFSGGNANQMAGAALLVVYSHPVLPMSTLTINQGVLLLNSNNQTTTFQQTTSPIIASSNAKLSLLTFADDSFNSGESIKFNGSTIGGPLDGNLPGGGSASIFNFNVTSLAGSLNQVTLDSSGDIYGWHVAVLQTPAPEPSGLLLAWLGVAGLALFVWSRRRGGRRER